ncbi:hypothetical protein [Streptomyces sp. NBC_00842]|uniref:hypothetical protein n=1 Tax=Streptomyces sp. NBC_00842 TaxID=2975848 RepID=UPI00386DA4B6|nr:hypothetical protein OH821_24095 [Streptomyces sp. NBC_00842]
MRMKIISVVTTAAIGLLTTACGGEGSGSNDAGAKPAPVETVLPQRLTKPPTLPEEELKPSPDGNATFGENLAYELRRKTLDMARAAGKVTATCPKGLEPKGGTKVTCTTAYDGLKVEWDVTVGDQPGWSDNMVEFEAVPRQGILTRDGVARLLYGNGGDSMDYALCNDIPDAVLVPLNAKSKYSCEVVFKGKDPVGAATAVRATDAGPRVY